MGQAILGYYIALLKKESFVACKQKLSREISPWDTSKRSPGGMGSPVVYVDLALDPLDGPRRA